DPHSGEDERYGRRERHQAENLESRRSEALREPDLVERDAENARAGVDDDDEDSGVDDRQHLRGLADSEPDECKRQQRDRRNEAKELGIWLEQSLDQADVSHQQPDGNADGGPDEKPEQDALHADGDVGEQLSALRQLEGAPENRKRRGEQYRR